MEMIQSIQTSLQSQIVMWGGGQYNLHSTEMCYQVSNKTRQMVFSSEFSLSYVPKTFLLIN